MASRPSRRPAPNKAELDKAFSRYDTDGSGTIDASELRECLLAFGLEATDINRSEALLRTYDASATLGRT